MKEALLLVHPAFGVLAILAALWVFVEAYRLDERRLRRMRIASLIVAGLALLAWFSGGLWDSFFYEADREVMRKGSWAFVGDTTMEMKEHLIVVVLLLALYLPILTFATDLRREEGTRLPIMTASALIVLVGLAMDGAGAILAASVRVGMATLLGS